MEWVWKRYELVLRNKYDFFNWNLIYFHMKNSNIMRIKSAQKQWIFGANYYLLLRLLLIRWNCRNGREWKKKLWIKIFKVFFLNPILNCLWEMWSNFSRFDFCFFNFLSIWLSFKRKVSSQSRKQHHEISILPSSSSSSPSPERWANF